MATEQMIWSGQGPIYFGTYDPVNGTPSMGFLTKVFRLGCGNSSLTTSPSRETKRLKESCSGQRLDMKELETSKSLDVSLSMFQFDRETLARAFFATSTVQSAGTVSDEMLPLNIAAGEYITLARPNASAIIMEDDSDAVLVENTNYTVIDAAQGVIRIDNLTGVDLPVRVSYAYSGYGNVAAFTAANVQTGIIFTGRNQDNQKARVIIPRVSLALSGEFNWIGDEESTLTLEGPAFYVPELAQDSTFGPFMRIDGLPQ